ncbi:hypothetical protein O9G_003262 [Rozella allomycis CSF55]|uniref:39S ribosomal protein L41, mitochondrial n=1 Tax=Rozella allomycis (strain CSF55) TaxID=988480 RepID=A0A075B416_ROZAC|nr:hypothetical protein O9G_003262 [Rozella allomycis CSF55]|eukprot:EPZ35779.1 hypothetical protein O9G_003262 [Rozella allomycis CSF55]
MRNSILRSLCRKARDYYRGQVDTKELPHGWMRGTGGGSQGWKLNGSFLPDPRKIRCFITPDLKDFKLTPYVQIDSTYLSIQEEQKIAANK